MIRICIARPYCLVSIVVPRSVAGTAEPSSRNSIVVGVPGATHESNVRVADGVVTVTTPLAEDHVPVSLSVEFPETVQLHPPLAEMQVVPTGRND